MSFKRFCDLFQLLIFTHLSLDGGSRQFLLHFSRADEFEICACDGLRNDEVWDILLIYPSNKAAKFLFPKTNNFG